MTVGELCKERGWRRLRNDEVETLVSLRDGTCEVFESGMRLLPRFVSGNWASWLINDVRPAAKRIGVPMSCPRVLKTAYEVFCLCEGVTVYVRNTCEHDGGREGAPA